MWWNDLKESHREIKAWMAKISHSVEHILGQQAEMSEICIKGDPLRSCWAKGLGDIQECVSDLLESEDADSSINRMHDKLDDLLADASRTQAALLAEKTLDKFEDYMKNVDKLNSMINEFKGCVSIARSAIEDRKQLAEQEAKTAVLADITKEIYKSMLAFIQAADKLESKCYFKLDAIYKATCCKEDKPRKPRKPKKRHNV